MPALRRKHSYANTCSRPLLGLLPWVRPSHTGKCVGSLLWTMRRVGSALIEGQGHNHVVTPITYSCSFRAFLRLRLRASASFTRFFSPGLR